MPDFPRYTEQGKDALDLFLGDGIAILFYFEDSKSEAIYERLVRRLFPLARRFQTICLGGKEKVIAKARQDRDMPAQYIFIVDKDYDDLLGQLEDAPDLFYWDRCTLENYLLSPIPIQDICVEEDPERLTDQLVRDELGDFEEFRDRLFQRYTEVTRLFIVARRFRVIGIETTKMDVDELLDGSDEDYPLPTEEWITNYTMKLQEATHGDNEWLDDNEALTLQKERAFEPHPGHHLLNASIEAHLNGKHLFYCLLRFIGRRLGFQLEDMDSIKLYARLIAKIPLAPFEPAQEMLTQRYPQLLGSPAQE
jgi:hypothetical protein